MCGVIKPSLMVHFIGIASGSYTALSFLKFITGWWEEFLGSTPPRNCPRAAASKIDLNDSK